MASLTTGTLAPVEYVYNVRKGALSKDQQISGTTHSHGHPRPAYIVAFRETTVDIMIRFGRVSRPSEWDWRGPYRVSVDQFEVSYGHLDRLHGLVLHNGRETFNEWLAAIGRSSTYRPTIYIENAISLLYARLLHRRLPRGIEPRLASPAIRRRAPGWDFPKKGE